MKKLILPIIFLVLLTFSKYSYAHESQVPKDCLKERHNAEYKCGQIHKACVERCSGPKIDQCIGACFDEQYKCDDAAKVVYDKCFNEQNPDKSSTSQSDNQKQGGFSTGQPAPVPDAMSADAISDWIIDNIGVYEPIIDTIEDTPLQQRKPDIDQSKSDPDVPKVAEINLIPGAKIKNYGKGIIIEISQSGWIYISPSGEVIYGTDRWRRYFDILMGTVEVDTNNEDTYVKTPNAVIKTKGTHYWVSYDPNKKETILGVYEGEVEVTTNDGKTASVSPNGDKPGAVVVSQKLSPVKLALAGVVLATVMGGVVFLLRRKKKRK